GASYNTYQIPDSPLTPATTSGTTPTAYSTAMSNPNTNAFDLNENQIEQDYFVAAAYQASAGDLNYQLSTFGQISAVHFEPDPNGDLVFNGEASDVDRVLYSDGGELDASYELGDKHTIRFGGLVMDEYLTDNNTTTVFNVDPTTGIILPGPGGVPGPYPITQDLTANALFAGIYAQDEWKILPHVTLNYGARFDEYYATYDKQNQPSPRVNLVYQPTDWTTLHIGYSRYFTPPPLENVPGGNIAAFNGTSGASAVTTDDTVRAERANYYDAGISQKITKHLQVGVDGYYKTARDQIDDGLFGQSLILSAFNYAKGRVEGVEFTSSYNQGGFSAYGNVAVSKAQGEGASSAQFLWPNQTVVDYVNSHWIYLDHDQLISANGGVSYLLKETERNSTLFYTDAIFGTGLREDGGPIPGDPNGDPTPNGASVPNYYNINMGVEQDIKIPHKRILKARIDVVNITDNSYQLRSGTGVGVNAPQYGERRGFFGSLTLVF
ncbi:MAG TPA: TonB-dependent receptor, partial [Candidatus Acidoferrum sp.]|nr:TonB-dependent receptor [Candidatus Acidoferrum sp.]